MHTEQSEIAFEWISRGRDERKEHRNSSLISSDWPGVYVSHLLPPVFEAYARIFHRIDAYYENVDNPVSASEIAILDIPPCEPLKSFVERRRANAQGTRVKWRELAELLDVPFVAEISFAWYRKKTEEACIPRFLRPGREWPVGNECRELVSILLPLVGCAPCFFRFSDIPFIGKSKPPLFKGYLDEVGSFLKTGAYARGFEYWWPSEHSWCVCSDFDLDCTIVGGSKKLISGLLESSVLECIQATSRTRVDPFAPMPV